MHLWKAFWNSFIRNGKARAKARLWFVVFGLWFFRFSNRTKFALLRRSQPQTTNNKLQTGNKRSETFPLCEIELLTQAVTRYAQAVLRNTQQGGNVFRTHIQFYQRQHPQVVAG